MRDTTERVGKNGCKPIRLTSAVLLGFVFRCQWGKHEGFVKYFLRLRSNGKEKRVIYKLSSTAQYPSHTFLRPGTNVARSPLPCMWLPGILDDGGSGDGQRRWDYDTTERSFNAISCAMYTDNAVGNVVAETGRDGGTTTRLSDRSMPIPLCASPLKGEALGCEETTVLCFLPSWSTLLFERVLGEEGRFDVASRSETPNSPKTSCQNHKQQLLRPRSGPAHTRTARVKEQKVLSKYYRKKESN